MKPKQLFFLAVLFISFISQAQVNTLFLSDSALIKGITTNKSSYKIDNLDNDGYWSKLGDYYVNYDDNLNILNTFASNEAYYHKFNNKLYSIDMGYHLGFITDTANPMFQYVYPIVDSFYLSISNLNGSNSYVNITGGNFIDFDYHIAFLKNKALYAVASVPFDKWFTYEDDTNKFKLVTIDTLGNVVNSRTYDSYVRGLSVIEQGNNIMVGAYLLDRSSVLYYIDNQTLDMVDSMSFRFSDNFKAINDSIIISRGNNFYYYIYNTHSKTIDSLFYRQDTWCEYSYMYPFLPVSNILIDARSEDSIVYAYRMSTYPSEIELGIKIDNFSKNGFNFRRMFNGFEPTLGKGIYGITCTNDGGIIFTIGTVDNNNIPINAYLLKYDPKGLLSVASVNPDEVKIIAYPNPAKDFINISSSSIIKGIKVYNTLGQEVYSSKANNKQQQINVSKFAKGNYIAKIQTDNGDVIKKFIVE